MPGTRVAVGLFGAALLMPPVGASAQLSLAAPDGKTSLRLGFLGQVQGERLDGTNGSAASQNLFLRRARLLLEGRLGDHLSLFVDTDSPNLGKAGADGRKNEGTLYLQDLVLTYAFTSSLKLDGGLLLLPLAYNTGQSAASLLGIDYGPYSFVVSAPTNCRVGRDYGLQFRGYLLAKHLETRAGLFQGTRGADATRPLRTFARVALHALESQTDFFYTGTTHGKRRLFDLGVSFDRQQGYSTWGADVFVDHPLAKGNALTMQLDYWRVDGGGFQSELPEQRIWLAEAGVYVGGLRLQPFVQYSHRSLIAPAAPDETYLQFGLAYCPEGHRFNLKIGGGRLHKEGADARTQILAQAQVLLW